MSVDLPAGSTAEVLSLPLEPDDPRTLAAAHLLLTEIARFTEPNYVSSHEKAVELVMGAKAERPGTAAIYALLEPETHRVVAAADTRHRVIEGDRPYESYSYVNKIAVSPEMRRRGCARKMLEHVDREAQRRGDVRIRLYPLVPEMFEACGFTFLGDGRMVAPAGAIAGLQAS